MHGKAKHKLEQADKFCNSVVDQEALSQSLEELGQSYSTAI